MYPPVYLPYPLIYPTYDHIPTVLAEIPNPSNHIPTVLVGIRSLPPQIPDVPPVYVMYLLIYLLYPPGYPF